LSVFPYEESMRRQLVLQYSAGVSRFDYEEETIYNQTMETLYDHSLRLSLDLTQTWGSANFAVDASQYLHDTDKNEVSLFGSMDIRLFRGLSLNLFGSVAHIANQLSLPKGGVTDEEILLRIRELATTFSYFVSAGLSFSFGSAYSRVVNPRLEG
jgi:hypothetical protein